MLVIDIGGGSTELVIGRPRRGHLPRLDPDRRRAPRRAPPARRPAHAGELDALRADVTLPAHPPRRAARSPSPARRPSARRSTSDWSNTTRRGSRATSSPATRLTELYERLSRLPLAELAAGPRPGPRSGSRDRCGNRHPARSTGVLRPPTGRGFRARHPLRTRALDTVRRTVNRVQNVRVWTCVRLAVQSVKVENHACRKGGRASRRRPPTHRSWRCRIIGASRRLDHPIRPHQGTYPCPS